MADNCFHASIEGAQHGAKNLEQFLEYARKSGATGAQPSNYMLQNEKGFKSAKEIKDAFAKAKLSFDGISSHCPFWVHTTAWTGTTGIRPFIPADVAKKTPEQIEKWAEDYLMRLLDLCAELGIKIVPMFWGAAFGWELATGYPWGFWKGGDQRLIDGLGPDGVSAVSLQVGKGAGRLQTGFLYHYAFVMLLGVAAILSFALWAWNA